MDYRKLKKREVEEITVEFIRPRHLQDRGRGVNVRNPTSLTRTARTIESENFDGNSKSSNKGSVRT